MRGRSSQSMAIYELFSPSLSNKQILSLQGPFDLLENQTDHLDRYGISELLVTDAAFGMELEACGKAHCFTTFLGMQAPWDTVDQVHASLGPDATAEG